MKKNAFSSFFGLRLQGSLFFFENFKVELPRGFIQLNSILNFQVEASTLNFT
jgi:hypothetical protein